MSSLDVAQALAVDARAIIDRADREGRPMTTDERERCRDLIDRSKAHAETAKLGRELGAGAPSVRVGDGLPGGDPGSAFVASESYRRAIAGGKSSRFTAAVEVGLHAKGTLLESPGGGGAGLVSVPQVAPGIVDRLFQPVVLENLLLSGVATAPSVRTVTAGTATSGAAGVAEGGEKPQSTLGFTTQDEPIRKIATTLKVSDEVLEDAPAISTFINGQLATFVRIEVERQLLRGTSGGNEVQGILTGRGVPVYAGGTAAGNKAVQVFKAMNGMRGSAFVEPDWVVINPTDWESIRLLTDTSGQYLAGGPFFGPYGGPQGPASASGQATGATDGIWGKSVYVTSALGAGTALVGSRAGAQVWNRGGLRVEVSNSDAEDFVHDIVAFRAERRLALSVMRPNAYVEVRLS